MRTTSYTRTSHTSNTLPWKWIGIVWWIVFVLIMVRIFGSSQSNSAEDYLTVIPGEQSSVYISMTSSSKSRITNEQKLFASDKSVSVELWNAIAKNESVFIDIDKWTELSYISSTTSGNILALSKWRAWIQSITKPISVEMKNYRINAPIGTILVAEQNGPYSNTYALNEGITIETAIGSITLEPGKSISLLKSDLINPNTNLVEWMRPIEWSIIEYPLFIRNNGINLIKDIPQITWGSWSTIFSWSSETAGSWSIPMTVARHIEITDPKAWILSKTNTVTVMGNLLSKEVKKVTINNIDATISPVNETFVLQNIPITSEIFDIVYKAYDGNNSLLESWVLTIFWSKGSLSANTSLIPETFPIATKDFKITFPSENPYSTTDSFIKVQWVVPKNTVDYIMVNDYRLQKFIPNSGTWYYFANIQTGTMQDWLNLYNIRFYKADGTLLYSQPFTIIKESKNATVSGE